MRIQGNRYHRWRGLVRFEETSEPNLMDLPALMAGLALPDALRDAIVELLARKSVAMEGDKFPRIAILDDFIEALLTEPVALQRPSDRADVAARIDAFFASVALGHVTATK